MNFYCSACGKSFGSLQGFDAHRAGKYTDEHPHYGRRCREASELESRGYRASERGVWSKPMADEARERLRASILTPT